MSTKEYMPPKPVKVNPARGCLRPINRGKENILKHRLIPIIEHKQLELIRVGILANPRDSNPEITKYSGIVKIKTSLTTASKRIIYCICSNPEKKKNSKKLTWTTTEELIKGLEEAIVKHPELGFYLDYLLILDKGDTVNKSYVITEFKKVDSVSKESDMGKQLAPEFKPLDAILLYKTTVKNNWISEDKGGYWIKHSSDIISDVYLNYRDYSFVNAKFMLSHTRNIIDLDNVFMIRGCDAWKTIEPMEVITTDPNGLCYEISKEELIKRLLKNGY